jgi:hypothetical protein
MVVRRRGSTGRLGAHRFRLGRGEQLPGVGDVRLAWGAGEEPVVADAVEALGEDVQQEAPDELAGREGHGPVALLPVPAVVLVSERDAVRVEGDQPAVRDGDAVGVAREIGEHRLGSGEGSLAVDEPPRRLERREEGGEDIGSGGMSALAEELQLAGGMRRGELFQHQPAKERREHAYRQKEARPARDPPGFIERDSTAGHNHVQVRMMGHRRAPGVQHRGDPDPRAEMLGIGGDGQQRLGRRLEQQVVDHRLVVVSDGGDRGRQGEDDVEVGPRQELGFALRQPVPGGGALALRAVAVAARVVGDLGVRAVLAARDVAAERRGPAARDGRHRLKLAEAHMARIGSAPGGAVAIEDVGDLQPRAAHRRRVRPPVSASCR